MKGTLLIIRTLIAITAFLTMEARAQQKLEPATTEETRSSGTFWSTTGQMAPTPFHPFPDLPTFKLGNGVFVYDDTQVDYKALREESARLAAETSVMQEAIAFGPGGAGGGGSPMMCQGGGLCLLRPEFDGGNVVLKIAGAEEGARYDVFATSDLGSNNGWQFVVRGAEGQTNLPFAVPAGATVFFQLGTMQDSDGDTLTDAFEALVSHTDPNVADTLATAGGNAIIIEALTPRPTRLDLHTRNETSQSALLGNPNPCVASPNSPIFEPRVAISWTNFVGGTFSYSWRIHTCDPETQTARVTNEFHEGFWHSNETGCVRAKVDDGPWSDWACSGDPGVEILPIPKTWVKSSLTRDVELGGLLFRMTQSIEAKVRLETGGPRTSLKKRFWAIQATAADFGDGSTGTGIAVAPEQITVMGKTLNSNGWAFFLLQDGTTNDVTPVLPPQVTNYAFNVSYAVADLKLLVNGIDRTDGSQTTFAGLPMNVFCKLDPEIAVITNYFWTIPNDPISNWVATATLGQVIPLPEWAYTNASVNYYWWKRATNVMVQCVVRVEGVMIDAKTFCDVIKPVASITATTPGMVAVDNQWDGSGALALHFGRTIGPPGIRFERTHATTYVWQWVQIVSTARRQRKAADGTWERLAGFGLDTSYPYPERSLYFTEDSPGMGFFSYADQATIDDGFIMFLMCKPDGGGAIFVPVCQIGWHWSAQAQVQNNMWMLISDPNSPSVEPQSRDATGFPQWNDNFINFPWLPE